MPKIDYGHNVNGVLAIDTYYKRHQISAFAEMNNGQFNYLTSAEYDAMHESETRSQLKRNLSAPFQVFPDMGKDIKDTFKPYKGWGHFAGDLIQPVKGIANLITGIVAIALQLIVAATLTAVTLIALSIFMIILPLLVCKKIYNALKSCCADVEEDKNENEKTFPFEVVAKLFADIGLSIMWGINRMIRGITQLAATPLTLAIKIPLRAIITLCMGVPNIEEDETVQRLLNKGKELLSNQETYSDTSSMRTIMKALNLKLYSGLAQGRASHINFQAVKENYADAEENLVQPNFGKFLNLFSPGVAIVKEEKMVESSKKFSYRREI